MGQIWSKICCRCRSHMDSNPRDFPSEDDEVIVFQPMHPGRRGRPTQADLILMDAVLMNELILANIFAQLSLRDLKTVRLVSHLWADVARKPFVQRSHLNLNSQLRSITAAAAANNSSEISTPTMTTTPTTTTLTFQHANYSLLLCDLSPRLSSSPIPITPTSFAFLPLYKRICARFGLNLTNLKIDLDLDQHTIATLLQSLTHVTPVTSLDHLWLRLFLQTIPPWDTSALERRQAQTILAAEEMLRIFSGVKFVYFQNFGFSEFQSQFLTQGILATPRKLTQFRGGRFTELDRHRSAAQAQSQLPGTRTSLEILTLIPKPDILTKVDFPDLLPGSGPALEKFLERFAHCLEEFGAIVGSCGKMEAFVLTFPRMPKLTRLHVAHIPGKYRTFDRRNHTEISIKFGFYPNFTTQLPLLQDLEVGTDGIAEKQENFNKNEDIFQSFFPMGRKIRCESVMRMKGIRNYYSRSSQAEVAEGVEAEEWLAKLKKIFPNARIYIWNE